VIENPENYIIVPLTTMPDMQDLRALDQYFGVGITALWCDALQTIVAFAFNNVQWNKEEAEAWVAEAKQSDVINAAGAETPPPDRQASPLALHVFDSVLADGAAAAEDDGLVWKEIIKPGAWFKMDTGRPIAVTPEIIQEAYRAFTAGLPKLISVPADTHHTDTRGVVPAESNRGFIQKLKPLNGSLYGGFKLTDPQIAAGVQDGSIADCSVYLQPDVVHPQTGEKFPWVLRHVLLTNNPLVPDLRPFGDIPAADSDRWVLVHYRKENRMPEEKQAEQQPEIILTGEAAQEYGALAALGLSAAELHALAEQREAIAAQAAELRAQARAMEVTRVVNALEGKDEHPNVLQIPGYRHYPVVIAAVEKALREAPLALDDSDAPLDAALLAIVNALPEAARIALTAETGSDKRPPRQSDDVSEAQVDAFLKHIS